MSTAVALGTFDGLHKGHIEVLSGTKNHDDRIAVIFDTPPVKAGKKAELLMPPDLKHEYMKSLGITPRVLDFCAVRDMSPEEFFEFLLSEYSPSLISCGFNYRFGKNAAGTTTLLKSLCDREGITLSVCDEISEDGETVSSSRIRSLIKDGDIEKADRLMPFGFSVCGIVEKGDMRGRTLGFPTANFPYPENLLKIKSGVYSSVCVINAREYKCLTYIGFRPTFRLDTPVCETHIKDFSGDLYGKQLKFTLKKFIRPDRRFASAEELKIQMEKDIANI